jgi:hypothetical protein
MPPILHDDSDSDASQFELIEASDVSAVAFDPSSISPLPSSTEVSPILVPYATAAGAAAIPLLTLSEARKKYGKIRPNTPASSSPAHRPLSSNGLATLNKRSESAPCRLPLERQAENRRQRARTPGREVGLGSFALVDATGVSGFTSGSATTSANNTDSEADDSLDLSFDPSTTSTTELYHGSIPSNPSDRVQFFKDKALSHRVERLKVLKAGGMLVNYQTKSKSIWQRVLDGKTFNREEAKDFLRGIRHGDTAKANGSDVNEAAIRRRIEQQRSLSALGRLSLIEDDVLSVVRRVCCSVAGDGPVTTYNKWESLENFLVASLNLSSLSVDTSEEEEVDLEALRLRVTAEGRGLFKVSEESGKLLTFRFKPSSSSSKRERQAGSESQAFTRLFLHALAKYHMVESRSSTDRKTGDRVCQISRGGLGEDGGHKGGGKMIDQIRRSEIKECR